VPQEHWTSSEQETLALARTFAGELRRGDVVALRGELGTGKTLFARGICERFGVSGHVSSPSFVILNRYEGKDQSNRELLIYHLDLYRVKSLEEIYDLGYEEFFYSDGITLVEWAEQLGDLLPSKRYEVRIEYGASDTRRRIAIESIEAPLPSSKSEGKTGVQ
jgi:tRNA threonylcarbamoyladenosine biosynthesis protein TsaE